MFSFPFFYTSFSWLLFAFSCLSFNKHLLYSRNILCHLLHQNQIRVDCHFHSFVRIWQIWIMKKQKTADLHEYLRNFPVESWSAYFIRFNQFLYSPQCQDKHFNCHLSVLCIYFSAYEFPFLNVLFFVNLKTVTYISLWHPARTNRSYSYFSMGAESGKKVKQWGDLRRHDCFSTPTTFRLDIHKHVRNLDKTGLVSVHPTWGRGLRGSVSPW